MMQGHVYAYHALLNVPFRLPNVPEFEIEFVVQLSARPGGQVNLPL